MRRLLYYIIACCAAVLFFAACDKECDISGGSVVGDGNSIILDLSSETLPVSRAVNTAATGAEVRVDHIDVLIFDENGNKEHHERVGGSETGNGTIVLSAKRSSFDVNAKYEVHLIANSTADVTVFAADDFNMDKLKGLGQTDRDIHMTGYPNLDNVPQTFLMDGIAHLEGDAATQVVLNDGDKSNDTKLKVTLRRAAAKLVIKINKGEDVEFNNAAGTRAGYYLRNMPYSTSVITGVNADAALRTPDLTDNDYFKWTQDADDPENPNPDRPYTLITVTAYAYAHSWDNASSLEKETRLIVNIPMKTIRRNQNGEFLNENNEVVGSREDAAFDEHPNSYYQIPVCEGSALERNTCYEVSLTINVPGGTDPGKPVVLESVSYEVRNWDEKTIDIGGESDRPTYLYVNEEEMEMRNINSDNATLRFVSSSTVHVSIDEVYYYNASGTKVTLDATAQAAANITATPAPALNGNITIHSDVPTNNAIRYIVLTVSNDDSATTHTVTIAQYPLEYITHMVGRYSYRSDFGANDDDGFPTTYERLNGQLATNGTVTSNTQISQRRVACYYSNGSWHYENRWRYDYSTSSSGNRSPYSFFASKMAKNSSGSYAIYYFHWDESGNYTYTVSNNETLSTSSSVIVNGNTFYGDKTSLNNPRIYHVRITATSGDYTLGKPRLDNDGYTDSGADNAQLVSPSFMIASQLGSTSINNDTNITQAVANEHCKQYVEVAEDGTVYDNWRLPTRAEINIINRYQANSPAMAIVLTSKSYWSASGMVSIDNASGSNNYALRCIRDAYDDKKTGN